MLRLKEAASGIGLFDFSRGDLLEAREVFWRVRASTAALALVLGWVIVQSLAITLGQRTIGTNLFMLRLMSGSGLAATRRVFLCELPRFALLAAVPLAHAIIARACVATAAPGWEFYAPSAAPSPYSTCSLVTLIVIGGLTLAAVALTLWDASVVARNPRAQTLGDRIAGTRIAERES